MLCGFLDWLDGEGYVVGSRWGKNLIKKEYKMVETMLMLILVLVVYNSTLWENGEYDTSKSNWVYWRDK